MYDGYICGILLLPLYHGFFTTATTWYVRLDYGIRISKLTTASTWYVRQGDIWHAYKYRYYRLFTTASLPLHYVVCKAILWQACQTLPLPPPGMYGDTYGDIRHTYISYHLVSLAARGPV